MMTVDRDEINLRRRRRVAGFVLLLGVLAIGGGFVYERYFDLPEPSAGANPAAAGSMAPLAEGTDVPTFDVVRVTRGGAGLMTGHAPVGAKLDILADGKILGEAVADAKGEWVLIFSEPLKSGGVELSLQLARSLLQPAAKPVVSPVVVIVVVPGEAKDHFIDAEGEGVVVIASPRDLVGRSMIMQRPGRVTAGEAADGLGLDVMDYGDDGKAVLSGRAPAYGEVRVYIDNKFQGSADADENGKWELSLAAPVALGQHMLRADQVDDKGKVQLRLETGFQRDPPLDPAGTRDKIIVQTAQDIWRISRRIAGDGFQYSLIFRADKNQVKDPDLIYPDQVIDLPEGGPKQP